MKKNQKITTNMLSKGCTLLKDRWKEIQRRNECIAILYIEKYFAKGHARIIKEDEIATIYYK